MQPLISWFWDDWTYWLTLEWSSLRRERSDREILLLSSILGGIPPSPINWQAAICTPKACHLQGITASRIYSTPGPTFNNAPWHEEKNCWGMIPILLRFGSLHSSVQVKFLPRVCSSLWRFTHGPAPANILDSFPGLELWVHWTLRLHGNFVAKALSLSLGRRLLQRVLRTRNHSVWIPG